MERRLKLPVTKRNIRRILLTIAYWLRRKDSNGERMAKQVLNVVSRIQHMLDRV